MNYQTEEERITSIVSLLLSSTDLFIYLLFMQSSLNLIIASPLIGATHYSSIQIVLEYVL